MTNHRDRQCADAALERVKTYHRLAAKGPIWWREDICAENNVHVVIGKDEYFLSADGLLMPARKDQAPPDLRYFKPAGKTP
jgi:hypothetical protein